MSTFEIGDEVVLLEDYAPFGPDQETLRAGHLGLVTRVEGYVSVRWDEYDPPFDDARIVMDNDGLLMSRHEIGSVA